MNEHGDITQALVLAAGRGRRLNHTQPKPLYPLLGVPLLARTLFALEAAGINDAYVVVGYESDIVREAIDSIDRLKIRVHWLLNPDWKGANGLSVLSGEGHLKRPFILTMGDHLFDPGAVRTLTKGLPTLEGIDLLVDYRLNGDHNLGEATKVRTRGDRILRIGKSLEDFDALDTGLFLASPEIFPALRAACAEGRDSLSDGVQELAGAGRARAIDGGELFWYDVDNPEDARVAARKLLTGLRSNGDGPVAKWLNRPISTRISARLVRTAVTPNQISLATLIVALIASALIAVGSYAAVVLGGILFHAASVLDGSDGEVARLKFLHSRRGEYFDTLCDNLSYVAFLIGLTIGAGRAGVPDFFFWNGVVASVACTIGIVNMNLFLVRRGGSGSARTYRWSYQEDVPSPGPVTRLLRVLHYAGKRDVFSFAALVAALTGKIFYGLPLVGIPSALFLAPLSIQTLVRARAGARARGPERATAARIPSIRTLRVLRDTRTTAAERAEAGAQEV